MQVTLTHSIHQSTNIHSFFFASERSPDYIAGQFIELSFPPGTISSGGDKRWFTLCSSPTESELMITTRIPENPSEFKRSLMLLETGAALNMSDAMGDFVLPIDETIPLLFVAGGIGITPYRSMLKSLSDKKEKRTVTLLYAAGDADEVLFETDITSAGCKLLPIINTTLNTETILNTLRKISGARVYLSGPEPMIEKLYKDLMAAGLEGSSLMTDYFPGYIDLTK